MQAYRPSLLASVVALVTLPSICLGAAPSSPATEKSPPHASQALIDNDDRMNTNNLDMVVTNHGSIAYDLLTGNAGLIYPRGTTKTAVFSAGIWLGAKVNGATRVAIAEYAQEFAPGPMVGGTYVEDQPDFRNYRIERGNTTSNDYLNWPVWQGAPTDSMGNPFLLGDVTIWSVFNDANPAYYFGPPSQPEMLGVEVQQTVFAFNRAGPLGNVIFLKWKVLNKGPTQLDSTFISFWADPDLGGSTDDLVGCDTTLSLGYCYNATNADGQYGSLPPAVGFQLLRGAVVERSPGVYDRLGMTSFNKYINGTDPTTFEEVYNYMQGLKRDGSSVHVLDDPNLPVTTFLVSGLNLSAPSGPTNWLDSNPSDRRLMLSSGPFTLERGGVQEILVAICIGQGSDRLSSVTALRNTAAIVRNLIDELLPPPPPPSLSATIDLKPNVINLRSPAPWVTAYIEPSGFDPSMIDVGTVRLAGAVEPEPKFSSIGDHDQDGLPELMLKFSRLALAPGLAVGRNRLEVTGSLKTGERFSGADEVQVIDPPAPGLSARVIPNPLNPSGIVAFKTAHPGRVSVKVFDSRGRLVRSLMDRSYLPAGRHEARFDGRGEEGQVVASGIYIYRIEAPEGIATGRVAVLK